MKALDWMSKAFAVGLGMVLVWSSAPAVANDAAFTNWLLRVHDASRLRTYTGTFVVSAGGVLASAKIVHVCDGVQQVERVDVLNGAPRTTYRHNDRVVTFYGASRIAVVETRESLGLFPTLLQSVDASIGEYYVFKPRGVARLAAVEADVIELIPKDPWRYGYRIWSERNTGLVLQLQTLDLSARVIEQAAFTELQLDAPVDMEKLLRQMQSTNGYRVEHPDANKVLAQDMGWKINIPVPGFRSAACLSRSFAKASTDSAEAKTVQWIFTDGIVTLSLFLEPYDGRQRAQEGANDMGGATHMVTARLGHWWATAVGEVPPATLSAFIRALERTK